MQFHPSRHPFGLIGIIRSLLVCLGLLASMFTHSAFAATSLQICNQTDDPVSAAYARYDDAVTTSFSSHGWFNISAHSCSTVSVTAVNFRYFYFYAQGGGLYWSGQSGTHSYCVDPVNAFNISNADEGNCALRGWGYQNFVEIDTGTVSGTYTQNLTVSPPICSLTASPASISLGGSSTLTASCSAAVTSYVWTGGTCAGATGPTCTVTPTATTTYSVAAINAGGKGGAAIASVTVTAATNTLTITKTGTGTGTVTGGSVHCGAVCSVLAASGTTITLTATADSGSTFAGWGGGCSGTGTCTVSMSQGQSVTAAFALTPASTAPGLYDGIYQWSDGNYLSVHQIGGGTLIGTIYWVYTGNSVPIGARTISEIDTFDLLAGQIVGSSATMTGTRFYRGCTPTYEFTFNNDSSLTVRLSSMVNSPGVSVAAVDCAARYNPVGSSWTIPKIY